ncbi:MAG: hypothetical protein V4474_00205 [Patescibacteria group bacterium]
MNTFTKNISTGAIALAVFAVFAFAIAPLARAADLPGGDYGGSYADGGYYDSGYSSGYSPDYSSGFGGSYADAGYYDSGYASSFGGGFGGSSFGGFGGGGGFFTPTVGGGGNFNAPTSNLVTNNGNTYTYAPQNTNVCTGGNVCNDNSIYDGRIVISGNNTIASQPATPVYNTPVYTPVYQQPIYNQPVAPYYPPQPRAPYVSLSAVPYTGLDLGTMGTIAYWSFLVLWCLLAAYLIAVKKVQNKIVAGLNSFLFPTAAGHAHSKHTARVYNMPAKAHVVRAEVAPTKNGIDPFISSQINRSR